MVASNAAARLGGQGGCRLARVALRGALHNVPARRGQTHARIRSPMKTRFAFFALAASALALAACNNPKADDAATAAQAANEAASVAPVTLPPAVVASKTYRCRDTSVVYVDFLSNTGDLAGSMNANIRTDNVAGTATQLTKADAEAPYTAEGFSVSGSGDSVTIEVPGKNAQLCKA
jgi:hypothetical protein